MLKAWILQGPPKQPLGPKGPLAPPWPLPPPKQICVCLSVLWIIVSLCVCLSVCLALCVSLAVSVAVSGPLLLCVCGVVVSVPGVLVWFVFMSPVVLVCMVLLTAPCAYRNLPVTYCI